MPSGSPLGQLLPSGVFDNEGLERWLENGLGCYDELRDNLAADATSRLSPYLHFGCVSPGEVAELALAREGGEGFVRQLCWRDFHHQLLAAAPAISGHDFRPRSAGWRSAGAVRAAEC